MSDAPIGVFDSGVGGLTVVRAVLDQLPQEAVLYVGDTARAPYGPRPLAQVRAFALEIMDALVAEQVKALVIACNSASSAVLRDARERYDVPVVEVVQPAAKRAVAVTRNRHIGIIGTQATIASKAYEDALVAVPDLHVTSQACPRFVSLVEQGVTDGAELEKVARQYLDPVREAGVDTLILGCTHYPMLTGVLSYVMGPDVALVSSAEETAEELYRVLARADLMRDSELPPPRHRFLSTGRAASFRNISQRFLGPSISSVVDHVDLDTSQPRLLGQREPI